MRDRLVALILAGCSLPLAADEWIRLTTPHFELFTTAGEKKGREAILYFEQVRNFFLQASPSRQVPNFPVRIIAFKSEKQYRPYRFNEAAFAYYTRTRMRDYIVMEDIAPEHYRVAIHEYTHLIIEHAGLKLPLWMNEGWADLYSTLIPVGNKTRMGELIPGHMQTLSTSKWLDLNTVTSVTPGSPLYNEKNRAGLFYAESWALVHMLHLSQNYRENFSKCVIALASGKPADAAFQEAFGRSTADVQMDLQRYIAGKRFFGVVFSLKLEKAEEEASASTPESFEVEMALADLLAAGNKLDEAGDRYQRLAKENPGKPEVEESLGYLLWQRGNAEGAREHFGRALSQGSRDARMCFDYAMLQLQGGVGRDAVFAALERAVELKPDYTEARLQLGLLRLNNKEWAKALIQLGQLRAVSNEQAPALFSGLALAHLQLGDRDKARENAQKAKKYAQTQDQLSRAEELIRYVDGQNEPRATAMARGEPPKNSSLDPPPPSTAAVTAAAAEERRRVQGIAIKLECDGKRARLHVKVGTETMIFAIEDPSDVQLKHSGESSFEFRCGPQKPFPVAVEYAPAVQGARGVAGLVRVLEF